MKCKSRGREKKGEKGRMGRGEERGGCGEERPCRHGGE